MKKLITHPIQTHIVDMLISHEVARFRDMRPPKVDTNLYSYHLKLLQKNDFVDKTVDGYTLGIRGLAYAEYTSPTVFTAQKQPNVVIMMVIQNSNGDVLLFKRRRQPYINQWTLPLGEVYIDDSSIAMAAKREVSEKLQIENQIIQHAGDCYIRIQDDGVTIMSTLVHVCKFNSDEVTENDRFKWARPHKLTNENLAPATEQIITRTFFGDDFFFEEYTEELVK